MITYKTPEEVELIRQSSILVGKTLGELKKAIRPGVSTLELDDLAETFIRDHGAIPAFKGYAPSFGETPFPNTLCTSVNEEVVHGMPSASRILKDGDVISIDCGVLMNGYYGDSAYTFTVGEVSAKVRRLLEVTKESLYKGIEQAVAGNNVGAISHAVQRHAETYGYSVVREMVGHGLGKNLHEPPEVPNYGKRRDGIKLREGLVIAIEPMINLGKRHIDVESDGWTIFATDRLPSAHFEHSLVIGKDKADILSTFEYIEN
ncbi:type I methionyl aminopeptidase [Pontibacter sp. G13]|uniref:type I methionyl aminopeptidase n=1 Tax=Pontibacter sp. G13 TaxID=3074898 RepID=UPI002889478E|nr:type I methionyl aminopeptidase [Pontibacter sp. G13]WNJ21530.1 type I methionyl aminopeptidase [Pontibacter sp. G13]